MGSSPRAAGIEGFHLKPKLKPANEVSGVWQRDACFLTLRMRHTAPHKAHAQSRPMFWTLPTVMTWTRIAAIPLIAGVFYMPLRPEQANMLAAALFVIFAATDWLDGFLARRLNQTSAFGAFLDPVADKFLVCACILVLVHLNRVDVFVALIIIGREIAISALREWMAQIGASASVAVHMVGKLKTTVQMVAIGFLLYHEQLPGNISAHTLGFILIWLAAALTVWSMVYYLQKAVPEIRRRAG